MLIGYVLVLVLHGVAIEPVTERIMTFEQCQGALQAEQAYNPDKNYGCAEVYRD
jgi:hypothetical protein|nr:MAG: hypothetical protein [Bacteriophage sp.]